MARTGFGTNIDSLRAQTSLTAATQNFAATAERLASGLRINKASDDAAGLALSASLQSSSRVFTEGLRNLNDGISLLSISENALETLASITQRQQELAEEASNSSYSASQRNALNTEAAALSSEFNRIVSTTSFNGMSTLDGTLTSFSLQAGYGVDGGIGLAVNQSLAHGSYDGTAYGNTVSVSDPAGASAVAVADVNGDGNDDFAVVNGSTVYVRSGSDGSLLSSMTAPVSPGILFSDFNNDGKQDLLLYNSSGQVNISLGNGDGSFGSFLATGESTVTGPVYVAVGDYNGDGNVDIVRAYTATTDTQLDLRLGNGNGTFRSGGSSYYSGTSVPMGLTMSDVNNDGKSDVLFIASTSTELFVSLGNASGSFASSATAFLSAATLVGTGDFNNDGKLDLLTSAGSGFQVSVGSGTGGMTPSATLTTTGTVRGFGDFNGDGNLDILSTSGTNGLIRFGNGNGTFKAVGSAFALGSATISNVASGDFNGDGALDITVVQSSNSTARVSYQIPGTTLTTGEIAIDLSTVNHARAAIDRLSNQLSWIEGELGNVGSAQSRLASAVSTLADRRDQYTAASSRITDIDTAEEVANYTRSQILQQTAAAALAHANVEPQSLLKLLG